MSHEETAKPKQTEVAVPPQDLAKPCEGNAEQAPKKKKLNLDIEEIGEVLERKISP